MNFLWYFFFDAYRIQSYCQSKDLMLWFWNKFANEYRRSIVKRGRETSSKNNKTGTFVEIANDELNTVSSNQQRICGTLIIIWKIIHWILNHPKIPSFASLWKMSLRVFYMRLSTISRMKLRLNWMNLYLYLYWFTLFCFGWRCLMQPPPMLFRPSLPRDFIFNGFDLLYCWHFNRMPCWFVRLYQLNFMADARRCGAHCTVVVKHFSWWQNSKLAALISFRRSTLWCDMSFYGFHMLSLDIEKFSSSDVVFALNFPLKTLNVCNMQRISVHCSRSNTLYMNV